MSITSSPRPVLWLRGEHDLASGEAVSAWVALVSLLNDGDVVVDLSGVTSMSASSVDALRSMESRLADSARALRVRAPSQPARRALQQCGADDLVAREPAPSQSALGTWVEVPRQSPPTDADSPSADRGTGVRTDGGP